MHWESLNFDFFGGELVYANLGGTGSGADASRPQAIRYGNVGSTSVESLGGSPIRFDLPVNGPRTGQRTPKNGINGRFAQINFAANTEVTLPRAGGAVVLQHAELPRMRRRGRRGRPCGVLRRVLLLRCGVLLGQLLLG